MSLQTAVDIPLQITSENAASERRITPSWSIAQLKTKLEPVTGVPPFAQRLALRVAGQAPRPIEAVDEENTQVGDFGLRAYAEIYVTDTRPPAARQNFTDLSSVEKYEMPEDEYSKLSNTVLAYKKANKLGRFDPNASQLEAERAAEQDKIISDKGLTLNARCRLLPLPSVRLGRIAYIGPVPEIHPPSTPANVDNAENLDPSGSAFQPIWIGVVLDEPTGKNDGTIADPKTGEKKRYFECGTNCGAFVKPERVEAGDFPPLDDLGDLDEDMEEI
ncbi:hypothetical protein L228DRAFT_249498 [Xylona heveae TC161]|uniref:CAP-Gly domain-containing protein n=1 Tax=Xylona heveae (strain CBS 132557 / TC161) TaxID=1328760 RepID=A0A165F8N4_XYLHT|nr:hypothetical protein L228DRAFT_249498 [Xylona heveae TC161]KZF20707.1 hypothetical protein L228DRAFT_249498 [Xylona heveae TC161]